MQSELGRDATCVPGQFGGELDENGLDKYGRKPMSGTSIFDPALTELMYRWFCPDGGTILDPFAGGSVRGIVANYIGFKYTGIELRQEQVDSNTEQGARIIPDRQPIWICGDSDEVLDGIGEEFDFIFSCPPYADLEVYSDLPNDLSNMDYKHFLIKYQSIITKTYDKLIRGGYAVFVVGEVRDKQGNYINFVGETVRAFINAGYKYYNEAILLNSLGTAMLRTRPFEVNRKLTKVHQNVLVFKKEL
jgi:tRNA G10  N-methylase Trm11